MKDIKENDLVYVVFHDHCLQGSLEPFTIETVGIVIGISDKILMLAYWEPVTDDVHTKVNNRETASIIISTIVKYAKLKRPKLKKL
jgi:hypothetical protein